MSSAKSPPAKEPATLQTTRQMLDELDALMDRMLALPVNDVDDPAPTPSQIVHMPTMSATLTVLDASVEQEETPPELEHPLLRESFPSYNTDIPPAPSETAGDLPVMQPPPFQPPHFEPSDYDASQFETPRLEPAPDPIPEEVIPPAIARLSIPIIRSEQPVVEVRLPRRPLASQCLLPLLWFNQGFDKGTLILGPPGRWLRGPRGRHILGLTGLTLVGAAGLWLVKDWLGWTG